MVAQGFNERVGKDFYSTFSPMASLTSVRAVFSLVVNKGWLCYHADIPGAFLRAKTETEKYMRPPRGVEIFDKARRVKSPIRKLRKSVNFWPLRGLVKKSATLRFVPM